MAAAHARRGRAADRMESRVDDYQRAVRAGFLTEANRQPPGKCVVIDATPSPDVVQAEIRRAVAALLRRS
jgi:thymidylate kinase